MSQFNWAFSTHFCPIKKVIYLGFAFSKTRPIETILGLFSELLSIQNVSLTMLTFSVIFKQRDFAMY